jgi:integrase
MATKINLQTPTARKRLAPRGKPYKARLLPGVWIGYRAAQSGTGSWIVIAARGDGGYWTDAFAVADDQQPADGQKVLDYEQAANRCRALARGDANAATDKPATIGDAVDSYEVDLTGRGRSPYNAEWVRFHLPPQLAPQPLALVTAKQLRDWRDKLLKAGMLPATLNRMLKGAIAAFNSQAKLDPRVAANAQAWKVGLEALPGTVTAREAVLTDAQVCAVVARAYDESDAVGLYVQTHAEVGARSSQLARVLVGDLQRDRLMVPSSKKGRGRKADKTPVPLTANLAARLKAATVGRPANDPLLLRDDGAAWQPKIGDHRRPFERAALAAKLPPGSTMYSLRHSSIARALLRGLPVKIVSDWHDTSIAMITAHYGKFLKHHYDDLVRQALLDTAPAEPAANVVALRA